MSCNKGCKSRYSSIDFDFGVPNRFDLEQEIMHQSDIVESINTVVEYILDSNDPIDKDKICNILSGIAAMHEIRHENLWTTFVALFKLEGVDNGEKS